MNHSPISSARLEDLVARLSQPKRVTIAIQKSSKPVCQIDYSDVVERLSQPKRPLVAPQEAPTIATSTPRTVRMDVIRRLSQPKSPRYGVEKRPTVSESQWAARPEAIRRLSQPKRQSTTQPILTRSIQQTVPSNLILRLSQPKKKSSKTVESRKANEPVSPSRLAVCPKTPPQKFECIVCLNTVDERRVFSLPCQHICCRGCLIAGFESSLSSRKLFKCCGVRVPTTYVGKKLPTRLIAFYKTLVIELTTRNPIYCSRLACSSFISPATIKGPVAVCTKYLGNSGRKCGSKTCVMCKKAVHKGVCKEDKDGMLLKALAKQMNWKTCPSCGEMVVKNGGCMHMSCRCGAEVSI